MIDAGNISGGHNVSGKVLCLPTNHGFVLIYTTDVQKYGDVVVNVISMVAPGSLLAGGGGGQPYGVGMDFVAL